MWGRCGCLFVLATHCCYTLLQTVGATVDPYTSSVVVGLVRLIVGVATSFLLNKFGHRPLFLISSFGMAVSMAVSGYYTKQINDGQYQLHLKRL